jgi:gliding motility-associated-like protein
MFKFLPQFFISMCCILAAVAVDAQSVGGTTSGAKEYCEKTNSGFISVSGYTGTVIDWVISTDGGATWTGTGTNVQAKGYYNLTKSTCFRAVVKNGAYPPDSSSPSCVVINAPSFAGTISGAGPFCTETGNGQLNLSGSVGSVLYWQYKINDGPLWIEIKDTTHLLKYASLKENVKYRVVVKNGATCRADTSAPVAFVNRASVAGAISGGTTVCPDVNTGLLSLSGNNGNPLWISSSDNGLTWAQFAEKQQSVNYSNIKQNTLYRTVVHSDVCKNDTSAIATVAVYPRIQVNAGKDTVVALGSSIQLQGSGKGTPDWEPGDDLSAKGILNPFVHPSQPTYYILNIRDDKGCVNSDTVFVAIIPLLNNDAVANVFTPNGDGINDTWVIKNLSFYPFNEVFVYNKFGTLVYSRQGYNNDWSGTYNGRDLSSGTYFYVLRPSTSDKTIQGTLEILNK